MEILCSYVSVALAGFFPKRRGGWEMKEVVLVTIISIILTDEKIKLQIA